MEDKKGVTEDLSCLLSKHYYGIESLEYFKPGNDYDEEVIVTYRGGYQQTINVSFDSIPAMLRDVVRHLEI